MVHRMSITPFTQRAQPMRLTFLTLITFILMLIDMNKRKIRLNKSKHYKFGIVLPAGEYEAVHILNDVWQVKQNGISLSVTEKQFDFVD